MKNMRQAARDDRFAEYIGIEFLDIAPGKARAQLKIDEKHFNGLNTVHGGVIFTLADVAFAAAANSYEELAMAINVNISYIKAITEGVLIAEAEEISLTPRIGNYSIRVTNEQGELIAAFHGMAYRKKA